MPDRTASSLTAADVMLVNPRTCSVFSSVIEAILIFREEGCGSVPVVDGNVPIGILTDGDVAEATAGDAGIESRPVSHIMTKALITVAMDAPLMEIERKFAEHSVHRVLVVDSEGQLQGIVARRDLAPYVMG